MNYDIHDINEWAEHTAYYQLDIDKQAEVLAHMSIEEYDELHQTMAAFGGLLQEEAAELEPSEASYAALRKKVEKEKKSAGIFAIRIPAYQAVAACFLAVLGTYMLFGNRTNVQTVVVEKEVPVLELLRDTIFREVPVVEVVTKIIYKERFSEDKPNEVFTTYVPEQDYAMRQNTPTPDMSDVSKSFGNTVVSADALEQFKVRM